MEDGPQKVTPRRFRRHRRPGMGHLQRIGIAPGRPGGFYDPQTSGPASDGARWAESRCSRLLQRRWRCADPSHAPSVADRRGVRHRLRVHEPSRARGQGNVRHLILKKNLRGLSPYTYIQLMSHTCAANLSQFFKVKGRIIPTCSACRGGRACRACE